MRNIINQVPRHVKPQPIQDKAPKPKTAKDFISGRKYRMKGQEKVFSVKEVLTAFPYYVGVSAWLETCLEQGLIEEVKQ